MLASSLAPGSVRQAQHIIRDTKKDTGSIKGRPALHQAKLRGANALLDITHRPRGAALLGSGALLAGATPVAVGARLKARHDRKVRKVAGVDYSWMKDATEPPRDPFNPNRRVKGPRSDFGARETRAIGQKLDRLSASRKVLRFGKLDDRGRRRVRNAAIGAGVGGAAGGVGLNYGALGLARSAIHADDRRGDTLTRADLKHGYSPKGVARDIRHIAKVPGGKKAILQTAGMGAAVTAPIGAGVGALATRRRKVEKAERYYDPEHTRQRRIGAAEAGLALAGATGAGIGGRQIVSDTKKMRKIKVRGQHRGPDTLLREHSDASGAFRIRRLPAGLAVGGATALGGAGYLHHRASTRRGAAYR